MSATSAFNSDFELNNLNSNYDYIVNKSQYKLNYEDILYVVDKKYEDEYLQSILDLFDNYDTRHI